MKTQLSEKIAFAPLPVLILATWNEDGTANAMNAAWGVQSDWAEVTVFLADHKTTDNLKAKKAFTVSFADRANLVASDYFGIESGRKADKVAKAGMTASAAPHVDAPVLDAYPLTLECEVKQLREEDGGYTLVGAVKGVLAEESILTDGKVDLGKAELLAYDGVGKQPCYRLVGEKVGDAFKAGLALK